MKPTTSDELPDRAYPEFAPLANALKAFSELCPDQPMKRLEMLLIIDQKPGITSKELAQRLNTGQSSISRNLTAMGTGTWLDQKTKQRKPALGLVEVKPDPREGRRLIAHTTQRGKALVQWTLAHMQS